MKTMKANGAATALVSGGFTVITEIIREKLILIFVMGTLWLSILPLLQVI